MATVLYALLMPTSAITVLGALLLQTGASKAVNSTVRLLSLHTRLSVGHRSTADAAVLQYV